MGWYTQQGIDSQMGGRLGPPAPVGGYTPGPGGGPWNAGQPYTQGGNTVGGGQTGFVGNPGWPQGRGPASGNFGTGYGGNIDTTGGPGIGAVTGTPPAPIVPPSPATAWISQLLGKVPGYTPPATTPSRFRRSW